MLKRYPDSAILKDGRTVWIDLYNPSMDEGHKAEQVAQVPIPDRDALEEIESSSRLRLERDTLYLSMTVSAHAEQNETGPTPVGFVLNERILVTVRYTELHGFDHAKQQLARGDCAATPVAIFTALLEGMVDFGADVLQQIAADLNAISRRVFQEQAFRPKRNVARQSHGLRRTMIEVGQRGEKLSQIRQSLLGLQRISSFVAEKGHGWIGEDIQGRLKTAHADLSSLTDFEAHLTNKVQFLLDAVLGLITTEQNDIFKVLTIVSVVGIPPTLIAGIYGMNFQSMPEYHWAHGYAWGLSLILLSTLLPVAWFKWRGWW
jgi:magnesium transporter